MLAERARRLQPSPTLAIAARARAMRAQGIDVLSFSAGEPDFDTPERVKAAAARALAEGRTKYTDTAGIPELRAAICAKLKRDNDLDYEPADIIVSVGAKHTLYNIAAVLFDPGDEVLVPAPYWVSYTEQVRLFGAFAESEERDDRFLLRFLGFFRGGCVCQCGLQFVAGASAPRGRLPRGA